MFFGGCQLEKNKMEGGWHDSVPSAIWRRINTVIMDRGHEVGCLGDSHPHLDGIRDDGGGSCAPEQSPPIPPHWNHSALWNADCRIRRHSVWIRPAPPRPARSRFILANPHKRIGRISERCLGIRSIPVVWRHWLKLGLSMEHELGWKCPAWWLRMSWAPLMRCWIHPCEGARTVDSSAAIESDSSQIQLPNFHPNDGECSHEEGPFQTGSNGKTIWIAGWILSTCIPAHF